MASETDICNLALAHLGNVANVASISPPEQSIEASLCARFYPMARDALLEMHAWGFATKRVTLAAITESWPEWDYAYLQPADAVNIIAVLSGDALDDYVTSSGSTALSMNVAIGGGSYVPQPFSCEVDSLGNQVILTDQANAVLRYSAIVSDTTSFSPLFISCLSWHLASMLAGPLIKGDEGAKIGGMCLSKMQFYLKEAVESDAGQRRINPTVKTSWIANR